MVGKGQNVEHVVYDKQMRRKKENGMKQMKSLQILLFTHSFEWNIFFVNENKLYLILNNK